MLMKINFFIASYLIFADLCEAMLVITSVQGYPNVRVYIPQNYTDKDLIQYWHRKFSFKEINFINLFGDGLTYFGYIPQTTNGEPTNNFTPFYFDNSILNISYCCNPHDTNCIAQNIPYAHEHLLISSSAQPISVGAASECDISWFPGIMSPLQSGNPRSDRVCMSAILGSCRYNPCQYKHVTWSEKSSFEKERCNPLKARQLQICKLNYRHNHYLCPYLHLD